MDEIVDAARQINQSGIEVVLVSMGAKGILLVAEGEEYIAVPPKVEVKNTIGAGDSAVAGFIYGLVKGKGLKEAIIFAAAAGTATTMRPGTALGQKDDFLKIVSNVDFAVLKGGI
jgi:6-phosphofructokinase 2